MTPPDPSYAAKVTQKIEEQDVRTHSMPPDPNTCLSPAPTDTIIIHNPLGGETIESPEKLAGDPNHGNSNSLRLEQTADPSEVKSLLDTANSKGSDAYAKYYWVGDLEAKVTQCDQSNGVADGSFTPSPYQLSLSIGYLHF
jgi:hypothetical protein